MKFNNLQWKERCEKLLSCNKFCCDGFFWGCRIEQQKVPILSCVERENLLSELLDTYVLWILMSIKLWEAFTLFRSILDIWPTICIVFSTYHYIILYHPNLDLTSIHLIRFHPQPGQGQSKRKGKSQSQSQGRCPSHHNHFCLMGFCLGPRSLLGFFVDFCLFFLGVDLLVKCFVTPPTVDQLELFNTWVVVFRRRQRSLPREKKSRRFLASFCFFLLWMNFTPNDLSKAKT